MTRRDDDPWPPLPWYRVTPFAAGLYARYPVRRQVAAVRYDDDLGLAGGEHARRVGPPAAVRVVDDERDDGVPALLAVVQAATLVTVAVLGVSQVHNGARVAAPLVVSHPHDRS